MRSEPPGAAVHAPQLACAIHGVDVRRLQLGVNGSFFAGTLSSRGDWWRRQQQRVRLRVLITTASAYRPHRRNLVGAQSWRAFAELFLASTVSPLSGCRLAAEPEKAALERLRTVPSARRRQRSSVMWLSTAYPNPIAPPTGAAASLGCCDAATGPNYPAAMAYWADCHVVSYTSYHPRGPLATTRSSD
jgi:hypothetical protein